MDHGIHYRRGHRNNALEQEGPDNHIGDRRLVDRRAADQDRRHRGQRHIERRHIQLDEAEALLVNEDADRRNPCGQDDRQDADPVNVDARSLRERRVGADRRHGSAGFGVQEAPHQERQQRKEQQRPGRDGNIADIDLADLRERFVVIALQRNGGAQALARKAPDHRGVGIRQQQPHHAHEGNRRKADVGRNHHFAALDLVEQEAIAAAQHDREGGRDQDCHKEARQPAETQVQRDRRAQQSGDNPQRQAEIESAARMDHRHHREHQHGVPAEAVDGVGNLAGEVGADKGRHDKEHQQEPGDNQPGQAELVDQLLQPAFAQWGCFFH